MAAGELIDLAAFTNALKVNAVFQRQFKQYLVQGFLLENLRRRSGKVRLGGRVMEVSLETRGNASFGAQQELEPISEPDAPGFKIGTIGIKTLTSRFQISLQAHLASQRDQDAWVGAKVRAMSSTVEMFGQNMSRLLHGWGTAALARVLSVSADTPVAGQHTIVLEPDQGASAGNTFGPKYIVKGLRLSASVSLAGLVAEKTFSGRVISVNRATDTIIVDGTVGDLAAADYLFLGSRERTSKGRAPMGIMGWVDDGTLVPSVMGIDRTLVGNEFWKARVSRAVGGGDLEHQIQVDMDEVAIENGGRTNLMLMSLGVWRRFANDLRGDRRYVNASETGRYRGGTKMLVYGGAAGEDVPITRDRDVPTGTNWGFDFDSWFMGELLAAGWLQQFDERSIFRWIQEHLAWEAVYCWMGETVCVAPNKQWVEMGITEAA